jgi:cation transport regulator ChaC
MIYFAYGLDLNPAEMLKRSPGHRSVGIARLVDWWFSFPRHSRSERSATMSIGESKGGVVWGALYEIPEEDMPILNHLYGYDPEGPPDFNDYVGRTVTVLRAANGEPVEAMTFVAVPEGDKALPSADYMALIVDGARYHGLPKAYLAALQAVKTGFS